MPRLYFRAHSPLTTTALKFLLLFGVLLFESGCEPFNFVSRPSPTGLNGQIQETRYLANLTVTIPSVTLALGLTEQLSATGTYSDGSTADLTQQVSWVSNSAIATISNTGLVTAVGQGSTLISAQIGSVSAPQVSLNVTAAVLQSVVVSPLSSSVTKGASLSYSAQAVYSDGTSQDVSSSASWASSQTSVATIDSTGLATALGIGSAYITASFGGITSGNAALIVTAAPLVSIAVTPQNASIAKGLSQTFKAIGTYSDNSTLDLTAVAQWSADNTSIASLSAPGKFIGAGQGSAKISAQMGNITSSGASLTVTAPTLQSIAITPSSVSKAKGLTQSFSAMGTYSDNSTQDLTSSVAWTSNNTNAVTIVQSSGVGKAVGQGSATIKASLGAVSATASFTVLPPSLVSIAITPASATLSVGGDQLFTATGAYSDNSQQNLTTQVSWSSSNQASVSIVQNTGAATALAVGTSTISISAYQGISASSAKATVTQAPVAYDQTINVAENLANPVVLSASDPSGDTLSYVVASQPLHGGLAGSPPNVSYTPNPGYVGPDSFTFQAKNGAMASNVATVNLYVIGCPTDSFGTGGIVFLNFGANDGYVNTIMLQHDGKILMGGSEDQQPTLGRLNCDGSQDLAWKMLPIDSTGGSATESLAVQDDGKIIVAASAMESSDIIFPPVSYPTIQVSRLSPDGVLDTTFGTAGIVEEELGGVAYGGTMFGGMTLQPDGRILVGALIDFGHSWSYLGPLLLDSNGTVDPSFNTVPSTNAFSAIKAEEIGNRILLQPDGKILMGGDGSPSGGNAWGAIIARYNNDGTVDSSFGTQGQVTTSPGSTNFHIITIALQSDGKILAAGDVQASFGKSQFAVVRINPNGQVDSSFGNAGWVVRSINPTQGEDSLADVSVQSDGKIILFGSTQSGGPTGFDFGCTRLNGDGSLDSSFGTNGIATFDYNTGDDGPGSMALQPDGKIILSGSNRVGNGPSNGLFMRLKPDGSLDK